MDKQSKPVKDIDWEDLYLRLYAFTDNLLRSKKWFRQGKPNFYLEGKEVHDYVSAAIEEYLYCPEKYDSTKGTLINYLKYYLIRSFISNDVRSSENRSTSDVFRANPIGGSDDNPDYLDLVLPHLMVYFEEELDYEIIMSRIQNEIKDDKIAEEIFLGICCESLSRREVIKEFGMSERDYDNGRRRLDTIFKKIVEEFNLKQEN